MDRNLITRIENILTKKKITLTKHLSSAFNIKCLKIVTTNNEKFVVVNNPYFAMWTLLML